MNGEKIMSYEVPSIIKMQIDSNDIIMTSSEMLEDAVGNVIAQSLGGVDGKDFYDYRTD